MHSHARVCTCGRYAAHVCTCVRANGMQHMYARAYVHTVYSTWSRAYNHIVFVLERRMFLRLFACKGGLDGDVTGTRHPPPTPKPGAADRSAPIFYPK